MHSNIRHDSCSHCSKLLTLGVGQHQRCQRQRCPWLAASDVFIEPERGARPRETPLRLCVFLCSEEKRKSEEKTTFRGRRLVDGVSWTTSRARRRVDDVSWTTFRPLASAVWRSSCILPQPYGVWSSSCPLFFRCCRIIGLLPTPRHA